MSKVTKEDMLAKHKAWYLAWYRTSDLSSEDWNDEIYYAIKSLIEKYGDLTDDVITATSIRDRDSLWCSALAHDLDVTDLAQVVAHFNKIRPDQPKPSP